MSQPWARKAWLAWRHVHQWVSKATRDGGEIQVCRDCGKVQG